jgi:hypothetical protein
MSKRKIYFADEVGKALTEVHSDNITPIEEVIDVDDILDEPTDESDYKVLGMPYWFFILLIIILIIGLWYAHKKGHIKI